MADLFEDYRLGSGWNGMFAEAGVQREGYRRCTRRYGRCPALTWAFVQQYWPVPSSTRAFPLHIVPRIITAAEWRYVQTGVAQRIRALEAFLAECMARVTFFPMV